MGGKTGTTSSSTSIPPEVLARYNSVNKTAESAAQAPFQEYSSDPNKFVAPINQQQTAGIGSVNQYAGSAQPAYGAAMQGTANAYQGFNAPNYQSGVQAYMNPYVQNAMGATAAQLNNVNQQQQQQMIGSAIGQGAFGGDRANIGLGALQNQQNLAMGQTLGNMASQGYQNAAQNYMAGLGQQGALANQMGALGTGAQTAGLQGAQAQIGAGTLQQQTQQAGNTALYNQFLQKQAYPFQVAQFLANIAEGTGALSGSNTTTTQPMSIFSDARLKQDIEPIGKTFDGQNIVKFRYKGEKGPTQIGLIAQDVERHHPDAVGLAGGYKTVDYDAATEDAANRGHFMQGGAVNEMHAGEGYGLGGREHHAYGAAVGMGYDPYDPNSIQNLIASQQGMYSGQKNSYVPAARQLSGGLGEGSRVPAGNLPVNRLQTPSVSAQQMPNALSEGLDAAEKGQKIAALFQSKSKEHEAGPGRQLYEWLTTPSKDKAVATETQGLKPSEKAPAPAADATPKTDTQKLMSMLPIGNSDDQMAAYGGAIHREHHAGGDVVGKDSPEGLYTDSQEGKLNIPNENRSAQNKLLQSSNLPGSMQDPTMKDLMTIMAMFKSSGGRAGYANDGAVVPESSDDIMEKYAPAIAKIESSGNYGALGPKTKSGDRAYGKYQVLGSNIPSWTKEATGVEMTPEDFLANKEAQDATFKHHFGKALSKYGTPEDAASVWFSGKPMKKAGNAQDALGTTVPSYISKFSKEAGLGGNKKFAALQDPNTRTDVPVEDTGAAPMTYRVAEDTTSPAAHQPPAKASQNEGLAGGVDANVGKVGKTNTGAYTDVSQQEGPIGKMVHKIPGMKDLPTSENLWVPALAGLGSMLSSRSPYLLPAIGEGLIGGTAAYTNLQSQQPEIAAKLADVGLTGAETAGVNARTEGTYQEIAKNALTFSPTGETWVTAIGPDGMYKTIREQTARKMIEDGSIVVDPRTHMPVSKKPLPNEGSPNASVLQKGEGLGAAKTGDRLGTSTVAAPAPAPASTGVVPAGTPGVVEPKVVGPNELSPDDENMVHEITKRVGENGPLFAAKNWGDKLTDYDDDGQAARVLEPRLIEYAAAVSQQPTSGAYTHGATAPVIQPLANTLNAIAATFGLPAPFEKGQQANEEAIAKAVDNLSNDAAASHNERAVAALDHFKATFPTKTTSREGSADNMATVLQQNKMKEDMQEASLNWRKAAGDVDPKVSNLTGAKFAEWYLKKNGPLLEQEHQKLKEMMLAPMTSNGKPNGPVMVDPETKQPMTVMRYIVQMGPRLDDAHKKWIQENYGDHILRYFPSVKQ